MWPGRLGKASWTRSSWEGSWGTSLAGDLSGQGLLARRHSGLHVQSSGGTTEGCRRVAWSESHFREVFSVWVWSRGSCSAIPRRAAAASLTFFLTGHIHGLHSDLLNQIFEGGPGPGFEQALLVISMHVTAWEPLSWRMDDRRDLENVYYKSLCLTNDWPEGPGWISNISKIKLVVVIIKTQVSWLCQEFCHANFLGSEDFHSIFKRKV